MRSLEILHRLRLTIQNMIYVSFSGINILRLINKFFNFIYLVSTHCRTSDPGTAAWLSSRLQNGGTALYPLVPAGGSLPLWSTCTLWIWRRLQFLWRVLWKRLQKYGPPGSLLFCPCMNAARLNLQWVLGIKPRTHWRDYISRLAGGTSGPPRRSWKVLLVRRRPGTPR